MDNISHIHKIEETLELLFNDSRNDYINIIKGTTRSLFRPMKPSDFKDAYLSISKEQGKDLVELIKATNIKNIVEFGTSFGISTIFLAQGALYTGGKIITTELIESKAKKALENFKYAEVDNLIELRVGDAMETLKNYHEPIDLLLLDGWKDLYLVLFKMLEPNFHSDTIVYVDNADMTESKLFLKIIKDNSKYQLQYHHQGKVALITVN